MKLISAALLFLALTGASIALGANENLSTTYSPTSLEAGKWRLGSSFDVHGFGPWFRISPSIERFLTDDLSLGLTGSMNLCPGCSTWSIGATATYYFWKSGRWAAYVGETLAFKHFGGGVDSLTSLTKVGVEYFFSPKVSLSPYLQTEKAFNPAAITSTPPWGLSTGVQLSIYF